MELKIPDDRKTVCVKCGRVLDSDGIIYYTDRYCNVYCVACGEFEQAHNAGMKLIKYAHIPGGFYPVVSPAALEAIDNGIYYAKQFTLVGEKVIYQLSGLCKAERNGHEDETIIECTDYKVLVLFSSQEQFPFYIKGEINEECRITAEMYRLSDEGKQSFLVDDYDYAAGIITTKKVDANSGGFATDLSEYITEKNPFPCPQKLAWQAIGNIIECKPVEVESILLKNIVNADFASEMLGYVLSRIKGQDKEVRKAVYIVYEYLKTIASGKPMHSVSWFITAPSGSGKTEFYRSIRDFFKKKNVPIPVIQYDMSRITETGFKGAETSEIPALAYNERQTSGYAICFLDEADKRLIPSYSSHGQDMNRAVQAELLTMVEGTVRKIDENNSSTFDTNKTMFVFMGAFQDLRERKALRKTAHSTAIGFSDTEHTGAEQYADVFYADITIEDMIEYGMLEELAGRITRVVNFHRISENEMRRLIRLKAEEISKEFGVITEFSEQAYDELLNQAYTNLGVRRPMNIIRECIQDALVEVVFEEKGRSCGRYLISVSSVYDQPMIKRLPKQKIPSYASGKKT